MVIVSDAVGVSVADPVGHTDAVLERVADEVAEADRAEDTDAVALADADTTEVVVAETVKLELALNDKELQEDAEEVVYAEEEATLVGDGN